ncbi:sulfurtransferase TusA family protein [Paenibacillus endoradicis]|uniref:sulfurtransferase TusA family protein n=1 Tax=Paenibacillus endoradicis TaxID=2972487 RepID=UPI00215948E9|nr:sulfurtransferase TusA family protein [Paenibacillus endoradicis]MCR8657160.1 sulfurtransferase TusA family protein [Paenibacillus endoradicis]
MNIKKTLDARALACPMPVVRARKEMKTIETGEVLEIQVTDRGALLDIPAWAQSTGHNIVNQHEKDGVINFYIEKG